MMYRMSMSNSHNPARIASAFAKAGFTVATCLQRSRSTGRLVPARLVATKPGVIASAIYNGGETGSAVCLHVQRDTERADGASDYFPGSFFDSITRAVAHAERLAARN